MDYRKEFMDGFTLNPPEYLPKLLTSRLTFISSLAHKEHREVYLTSDSETGGKAILKVTEPKSADSVKREYELLSKLDHPAIPKAYFYHKDENEREYLLREYLPGDTLNFLIERDGVFDTRMVLETIKKLCGIISFLHRQNPPIVYRDLKPQNIIMTPNGKVSLIDFGISREDSEDKAFDTVIVGSRAFAAPEMYGFTKSDSRTDIFMLGRLALYLCTGNYNQQTALGQVPSKELLKIIKKCTELSPEKRYATVQKLTKAIDRILFPPTRKEIIVGMTTAVLCLAVGFLFLGKWLVAPSDPLDNTLIGAGGTGYEDEVKIPVFFEILYNGQPFSDCAVAVDNHHWYEPAANGKAELFAYAYDEYKIRAATGNRTAFVLSPVTKNTGPFSFTFDLAKTPDAPDYIPITLPFGTAHEIPLDITNAKDVTFIEQPEGVSIEKRGDGFFLIISAGTSAQGHYYLFAEATNDTGKADVVISLNLTGQKTVMVINTAKDFDKIRDNLSGSYILGGDIDLGGIESWPPIGTAENPFTGEFDGNGYTISGLRIQGKQSMDFVEGGLFGVLSHGTIRNVIIRDSSLYTTFVGYTGYGFIAGKSNGGLIENCAVFDSEINANVGLESGVGGICGINSGIVRSCYSEAEVTIFTAGTKSWMESTTGGICGTNNGYLADCGNSGKVTGISLAGGIAGMNDMGILTRCYNAGYVKAPAYFNSYFPGGISHLLGRGKITSYCAFEKGTAQIGSSVFNGGTLLGIVPVERETFRDLDTLGNIFHTKSIRESFAYASLESYYPIPVGIFTKQAKPPLLPQDGYEVNVAQISGVKYFYTVDGADPHTSAYQGVDFIDITLKAGQTIRVYAAKLGCMDSEIVAYTAKR